MNLRGFFLDTAADFRICLRVLLKRPLLTIGVVLSLALGIGLNTAVFSLINALLLQTLPGVEDDGRIMAMFSQHRQDSKYLPISYLNFLDIHQQNHSFSKIAACQVLPFAISSGAGEPEQLIGEMVSADYFDVLGMRTALGRVFNSEETSSAGAQPVVVLGHELWRRRFGAEQNIIGQIVRVNGRPFTVIGVAANGFQGTNRLNAAQLWVSMAMYEEVFPYPELYRLRSGQMLQLLGRLRPDVGLSQAKTEMKAIAARLEREYPADNEGQTVVVLTLAQAGIHPNLRPTYLRAGTLLMGSVCVLLFIACINISNLLLVRFFERRREIALRLCLGASKLRLARQLLVECILLSLLGGASGLLAAAWVQKLLWNLRPPSLQGGAPIPLLNLQTLMFTLGISILTTVLFSIAPLLQAAKVDLVTSLKETTLPLVRGRFSTTNIFVVGQIALCAVSIMLSAMFLKSLYSAQAVDPGFEAQKILMVSVDLQAQNYAESRGRQFYKQIVEATRHLPGVQSVGLSENRLLGGFRLWRNVKLASGDDTEGILVGSGIVDRKYFETVGIGFLRGRTFDESDNESAPPVVIVNQAFANRYWPDENAVGKSLSLDDEARPVEIVGIVRNTKYLRISEEVQPFLYLPSSQRYSSRATLHILTSKQPELLTSAVRRELGQIDGSIPLEVRSVSKAIKESLWAPRIGAMLLSVFSILALALSMIGIYGVTAYSVKQSIQDFAVRMALGAGRATIMTMILMKGLMLASLGLLGGIALSLAAGRMLAHLLYDGGNGSLVAAPVAGLLLAAASLCANIVPALRATFADPAAVLQGRR